jgi:hypothetical protein
MNRPSEPQIHAKIANVFALAKDMEPGLFQVTQLTSDLSGISIAVNCAFDIHILLPQALECTPCRMGRIVVSSQTLEACPKSDSLLSISGFFLVLQASSVRESLALIDLLLSFLSSSRNSSFTQWLKRIADLFTDGHAVDQVGIAGELLFLSAAIPYNSQIISFWNPLGYSPFDFSPPLGIPVVSPYAAFFEVKTSSLESAQFTLKIQQLRHQASISQSFAYVFVSILISSVGIGLTEFSQEILREHSYLEVNNPDIYAILRDKLKAVQALDCLCQGELRFDPHSSKIRLATDVNLPFPEPLHPAIVIDNYRLTADLLSTLSVGDYFSSVAFQ